jgi:hypothetical protein
VTRDIIYLNCQDGKHEWQHIGGTNAGCGPECHCSVPVHACRVCGDYDYGCNDEAEQIKKECFDREGFSQ